MDLFRLSISKGSFNTDSNFMLDLLLFCKRVVIKSSLFQKLRCSHLKLRLILLENSRTIKYIPILLCLYRKSIPFAFNILSCYAAAELCRKTTDGCERLRESSFSVLTKRRMICRQSEKGMQWNRGGN